MQHPLLDGRELAAVALTFSGNFVVHRMLPPALHIPANLLVAGGVTRLAAGAGASLDELGLSPAHARNGLRLGALLGGAAALVVGAGAILPSTRTFFTDQRVTEAGRARAFYELVLRIPLGTALAEELLFRSGLTALFGQRRSPLAAVATASTLFGFWHVIPASEGIDVRPTGPLLGAVAVAIATTAAAGVGFSLLARRARSVVAPVLLHTALNGSAYAATRLLTRAR